MAAAAAVAAGGGAVATAASFPLAGFTAAAAHQALSTSDTHACACVRTRERVEGSGPAAWAGAAAGPLQPRCRKSLSWPQAEAGHGAMRSVATGTAIGRRMAVTSGSVPASGPRATLGGRRTARNGMLARTCARAVVNTPRGNAVRELTSASRTSGWCEDMLFRVAGFVAVREAPGKRRSPAVSASSAVAVTGQQLSQQRPYCAVLIVPTGVGAAVGGYAGDALPVARALSSVVNTLITHPNVLNGAMLYWPLPNTMYVEGFTLDQFAAGNWGLVPVHQNRVGLVLDGGMEHELQQRHLQAADAARATLGLPIVAYTTTDKPLQVEKWIDSSTGASTGRIGAQDSLFRAVELLMSSHSVDAVAVVARFPDDAEEELVEYRAGEGVDGLAGVEAVISHSVVQRFGIPCAHAPALAPLSLLPSVAPRSAAEEIGYTFLPCVLAGLSKAPQLLQRHEAGTIANNNDSSSSANDSSRKGLSSDGIRQDNRSDGPGRVASSAIWAADVDCVILPWNAFGGDGALAFSQRPGKKPLFVAVEENTTVMNDPPSKFGIDAIMVKNYWEALGVVVAHKAGINPWAMRSRGVDHLQRVDAVEHVHERVKDSTMTRPVHDYMCEEC